MGVKLIKRMFVILSLVMALVMIKLVFFNGSATTGVGPASDATASSTNDSGNASTADDQQMRRLRIIQRLLNLSWDFRDVLIENLAEWHNFSSCPESTTAVAKVDERTASDSPLVPCDNSTNSRFLTGKISMAYFLISDLKEEEIFCDHPELSPGGEWKPADCVAHERVAIIIPYRDRKSHLVRLLAYLIPVLQRQRLDFRFIVAEQYGQGAFNKGRIMNAAFTLVDAMRVDCVIFHDVDLFPQDDRNLYSCAESPLHLGAYVSTLGYELPYYDLVGGVLALSAYHFKSVNGFSNMFWQWGGEDDDMAKRLVEHNYTIHRPPVEFGAYTMIKHVKRQRASSKIIHSLLRSSYTRWQYDGVANTSWEIVKIYLKPLYYHMYIDVGNPPRQWISD